MIPCDQVCTKETKSKYPYLPALVIAEGKTIYGVSAIARYLARNNPLYKSENEANMAAVDSWMGILDEESRAVANNVIAPVLGHGEYSNKIYHESLGNFKSFLRHMNEMGEFLVGTSMTIADLYGAATLFYPFALVVDDGLKKSIPKVAGWYSRVVADPDFAAVYGAPRFCKVALKPVLPSVEDKLKEKEKKDKKDKKKEKKGSSDEESKEKKGKKDKKDKKDEEEEEEGPKKKPPNPLDLLPPTPFNLDNFKRSFFENKTSETRRKFLQERFWKEFDDKGWALWYLDYVKAEGECEVLYKTSNLLGGFIWRIDTMGRYGFGVHAVFGEEPNLEMRGAYMWRGTEIPPFIKDHPSFEFYKSRKLDPSLESDRKVIEDFWCSDDDEMVLGLRYREGKYFR
eukprot:TRINITY_DN4767_c0_g1_i1.p2 TRINITY_DN4767_c0_g1~~TRINITY_DN4767_c0_g1_i1.p2  ORF type:complete len:399 (+),score=150.65 TRINITY_DN4767_c0_g1_i1:312-1508(+)